jgi:anti-sigma regulatory factor (Ser/Thr protein kinase)
MRRNAESLLVLAGIEPPRKWAAPVRLADVIRAALGEVEDYQRVTIRNVEPATVMGSAAADLAHLIAEFVENALTFSPPDQSVEIRGRARSGGYTLAVIDNGFGMSAADIDQANRRLAGAESFTIAPSKYLGHYVAGNLAARHGIHVTLGPSPGTGVTATIELPGSLLTADTAVPDGTPSHPRQASAAAALANASSSGSGNGNGANGDGVAAPAAAGSGNGAGPGRGVERVPSGSTPAINVASGSAGDGGSSDGRGEPRGGRPEGLPALPAAGPTTPTLPGPARPAAGDGGVAPLAPAASLGSGAGLGSGPAFGSGGVPGTSGDPGAGGGTGRAPGMPTPGGWFYASAPASEASPSGPAPSGAAPSSPTQFGGRLGGPAMPAGPGLTGIAGLTGRPSGQTGAVEASRTASGLTKRARRPGEPRPAASVPSDDLLASLARHNANLRVGDRAALAPLASAPASPNRPPLAGRDPRGPGGIGGYPPPGGMPGAPPAGTPSGRMPTGPARERGPAGGPSPGPGIGGPMGPGSGVPGVPAPGPSLPGAPGAGDPGTGSRGGFGTGTGAPGAFGPSTGGPGNGGPGPSAFGNPTAPGGRGPGNGGPVAGGPLPGPGSAPGGYGPGGGPPPAGAQWSPGLHGGQGARPRSVPDGGAWPSQAGQPAAAPPQRPAPLLGHPGAPPVDAAPPPAGGATTAGGLARRVRGAQMPTSRTPVNISRAAEDIPSTPPPTARDVYGFLTSFSEGVQRGLDDVRGDEGRPPRG